MVFGIFGGRKKLQEATDSTVQLLASQIRLIGLDLNSAQVRNKALTDRYLLGYIAGASRAVSEISSFSQTQMGELFLKVTERLFGTNNSEHAKFHLNSMKQRVEASLVGTEEGYFEVRRQLGAYIGGAEPLELAKLVVHLESQYASPDRNSDGSKEVEGESRDLFVTYESWDEWYLAFKHRAGECNVKLEVSEDGTSFMDFLDHEPLRRAYADKVDPEGLAEEFAAQFDMNSYLPE